MTTLGGIEDPKDLGTLIPCFVAVQNCFFENSLVISYKVEYSSITWVSHSTPTYLPTSNKILCL